ncbi:hypothetical protein EHQ12_04515 [Leptospira gomenensis]|uniref:Lipoprotein n=1 Tax=Leptospira gomenensis TaxID=2484974 RepID=A0A5F1YGN4_9LEPT|nr:hypothetical protein [Leptospira gomenensis]TGK38639.1 hypothetical protein EHQ17_00945 [Leptospira gomenensis]TGK42876.1 hypothetical protein EHQ12_04515 [Leptospira gomenensis]TGK49579.1 hypothetical protein EHQ07_04660 [Leptospira gomenensis]TGK60751.1 hypothetical protein EHQ13_10410 [Leptospira gomenensis]
MLIKSRFAIRILPLTISVFLFGIGCMTYPHRYDEDCTAAGSDACGGYRGYYSPYGFQNQYGYPRYYRQYPRYYNNGGGSHHNPFHVPSGRYHNLGRPSKWKL